MQKISEVRSDVCRDRSIAHNSANSRRFDERQENLSSRRTVWWGRQDSNFQPNDYQSASSERSVTGPLVAISWLAKCPRWRSCVYDRLKNFSPSCEMILAANG